MEWSAELAYAVGLMVTDGNLPNDGRHINLRSCDVDLLETFIRCLNVSTPIKETFNNGFARKRCFRVHFSNVHLYYWFLSIGLFPAKTYTIGLIDVPDIYFRDFLRGHLDGDGSITTYLDNYEIYKGRTYNNYRVTLRFISASPKHIIWLQDNIYRLTNLKGATHKRIPKLENRVPMWILKFSKKESIKLIQWMYYQEGLPALQRKAKHAKEVLDYVAQEKRKTWTKVDVIT